MAYMNTTAILTRLREVLDDAAGNLRTIAASRFSSGLYEGLALNAQTIRALSSPRFEPSVGHASRNDASPPAMHSLQLRDIEVTVKVIRAATLEHKLTDAQRDSLAGLAADDMDVIAQAFTAYQNLLATNAAAPTGIVSGVLSWEGSDVTTDFSGELSANITSIHNFIGVVRVDAATS